MATLVRAIDRASTPIEVFPGVSVASGYPWRYTLDSEVVYVRGASPDGKFLSVDRGADDTVATSHNAGTTLVAAPIPTAGGSAYNPPIDQSAVTGLVTALATKSLKQNFDVRDYGTVDITGVTPSDAAVAATVAALVAAGGGTLKFPAGTIQTAGGFVLSVPCTVAGEGSSGFQETGAVGGTIVTCTSRTASLFTITGPIARLANIALKNTAALAPNAGAGVLANGGTTFSRVDFEGVTVSGFWIGIDVQTGSNWTMHACSIYNSYKYGLRARNTAWTDTGDWSISDTWFYSDTVSSDAAIRIESGGGGKMTNLRVNGISATQNSFGYGIDLYVPTGVSTGELFISNCLIGGVSVDCFRESYQDTTSKWQKLSITTSQFANFSAANTTGHAVNLAGNASSNIDTVVLVGNIFDNYVAVVPAVTMSYVNNAILASNILRGYPSLYSASNCTKIVDSSGSVASGVAITGVPAVGQAPLSTSASAAAWATLIPTMNLTVQNTPGLIGYWRLGEQSGTVANDASGHGYVGAYVNAPTLAVAGALYGDVDTAATFLGSSSQAVTLGTVAALGAMTTTVAVEAWIKKASAPSADQVIFSHRSGGILGYSVYIPSTGDLGIFAGDNTNYGVPVSGVSVCDNAWHHIVAQRNGNAALFYVDGVLLTYNNTSASFASVGSMAGSVAAVIGSWNSGGYFTGSIDEVAVYNRVLTAVEVAAHYHIGHGS
jgi:hypothetical protein